MFHSLENLKEALADLLPAMEADGGGAELVSFEDGIATVRLVGSCNFCPSRQLSASALKRGLLQRIGELKDVNVLYPSLKSIVPSLEAMKEQDRHNLPCEADQ